MSFGINGPDNIPSIQKSHHTNDGGAGNLGYFQQERRKKKNNDDDEKDIFELSENKDTDDDIIDNQFTLDSIGSRIKNFWLKLNKQS